MSLLMVRRRLQPAHFERRACPARSVRSDTRRHELGNAAVDGERDGGSDRQATQLLGGLLRGAKHEGGAGKWRFDDGHIVLAALKSAEEVHEGLDGGHLWQIGGAGCAGGVGCTGVADCGRCDARRVGRDG